MLSKPKRKLKGLQNETISFRDPKRDASKKSDFVSVMSMSLVFIIDHHSEPFYS